MLPVKIAVLLLFVACLLTIAEGFKPKTTADPQTTFEELIASQGFALQTYSVTTDDGYILKLHRVVPLDYSDQNYTLTRRPVLLQHGLLGSANNFFINSPVVGPQPGLNETGCGDNFGFCLVRTGRYDVWAGNSRGNGFSNGHVTLSTDSLAYWNFTFDQMARFDLPATIKRIQNVTGHQNVGYVGHSQVSEQPSLVGVAINSDFFAP